MLLEDATGTFCCDGEQPTAVALRHAFLDPAGPRNIGPRYFRQCHVWAPQPPRYAACQSHEPEATSCSACCSLHNRHL